MTSYYTVKTGWTHIVSARDEKHAVEQIAQRMKQNPLSFINGVEYGVSKKGEKFGLPKGILKSLIFGP